MPDAADNAANEHTNMPRASREHTNMPDVSNDEIDLTMKFQKGMTITGENIVAYMKCGHGYRFILKGASKHIIKSGSECGGKLVVDLNLDCARVGAVDKELLTNRPKDIPLEIIGAASAEPSGSGLLTARAPTTLYLIRWKDRMEPSWHSLNFLQKYIGQAAANAITTKAKVKFEITDTKAQQRKDWTTRLSRLEKAAPPLPEDPYIYQDLGMLIDPPPREKGSWGQIARNYDTTRKSSPPEANISEQQIKQLAGLIAAQMSLSKPENTTR